MGIPFSRTHNNIHIRIMLRDGNDLYDMITNWGGKKEAAHKVKFLLLP